MKGCEAIRDEMKAYLDGEMSPIQRASMRLHLLRCRPCREEREAMEEMATSLRAGDPDIFPPDLRARIVDNAAPELPDEPDESPAIPWWRQRSLQLWSAAACVVLAWCIIMPLFSQPREFARKSVMDQVKAGGGGGDASNGVQQKEMLFRNAAPMSGMAGPLNSVGRSSAAPARVSGNAFVGVRNDNAARLKSTRDYDKSASKAVTYQWPQAAAGGMDGHVTHAPALPPMQRHVVKSADITVEVEKLEEKSDSVERMVRESGGFVANNQLTTAEDGTKASALTLKVPVDKFDATLAAIAKLGEVKAKNVTGEDITEKVSDQAQETRVIRDDLKAAEQARTAKDRKLGLHSEAENARQLRIRLAQAEARVTELRKLSALATMTVQLREKGRTAIRGGFLDEMGDTARAAVNSFMQAARLPVLLLIWLAAYAPVWVPLAIAYRYAAGAHKRHSAARETREWQARRAQASEGVTG